MPVVSEEQQSLDVPHMMDNMVIVFLVHHHISCSMENVLHVQSLAVDVHNVHRYQNVLHVVDNCQVDIVIHHLHHVL